MADGSSCARCLVCTARRHWLIDLPQWRPVGRSFVGLTYVNTECGESRWKNASSKLRLAVSCGADRATTPVGLRVQGEGRVENREIAGLLRVSLESPEVVLLVISQLAPLRRDGYPDPVKASNGYLPIRGWSID